MLHIGNQHVVYHALAIKQFPFEIGCIGLSRLAPALLAQQPAYFGGKPRMQTSIIV